MYDSEEQFQNLKAVANTTYRVGKEAITLIDKLRQAGKSTDNNLLVNPDINFLFTGQGTDLSYFLKQRAMPISLIENIQDEKLKYIVKEEFNKAARDGKIVIDSKSGIVSITDKGIDYIKKDEFIKAAKDNTQARLEALELEREEAMETLGYEIGGTKQDLNYFRFADKIDLTEVTAAAQNNPELLEKVLENFSKMKDDNLIELTGDRFLTLTQKGKELLDSPVFKAAAMNIAEKPIAALSMTGKIVLVTKRILNAVKTVAKATSNSR